MTIRVLNPTSEAAVDTMEPAQRLTSLEGKTVGLISNGKEGTAGFFCSRRQAASRALSSG
jgi:hypothetical protein